MKLIQNNSTGFSARPRRSSFPYILVTAGWFMIHGAANAAAPASIHGQGQGQGQRQEQAPGADAVVVFLSSQEPQVNIATLEFYRAATDEIAQAKAWSLVGGTEVSRATAVNGIKFVGKIPVLAREQLVKSHPEVSRFDRRSEKESLAALTSRRRIIPQIQETLDTMAIQGAVIIDCQQMGPSPAKTSRIRGCGLYYYDRAAGRIVASSRKSFRVGVASASMWAPSMVESLKGGLDAHKAKQDRERLTVIESKSESQEKPGRPYILIGLVGESLRLRGGQAANLAGGYAGVGAAFSGRSLGIEYAQTSFRGERDLTHERYESRSADLVLGVTAEAMDIVTWGLDITAGMSERRHIQEDVEVFRARQPVIGLRPGVFWKVRQGWLMGATISYRTTYGGEEKFSSALGQPQNQQTQAHPPQDGAGFRSASWSTGFSTRLEF